MSKIKNGGLDQYGAGPFEQQQFGTAGVEGVDKLTYLLYVLRCELARVSFETYTISCCYCEYDFSRSIAERSFTHDGQVFVSKNRTELGRCISDVGLTGKQ